MFEAEGGAASAEAATGGFISVWATADEWRQVREVRLAALADSPDSFVSHGESTWSYARWRRAVGAADWLILQQACGRGIALARAATVADRPGQYYVESLWVAPLCRRIGLARQILDLVELRADALGLTSVSLSVLVRNGRALRVFRACGFDLLPTTIDSDEIDLARRVRPGSADSVPPGPAIPLSRLPLTARA